MCLTIPAKIISINNNTARVQTKQGARDVFIGALSDIKMGDWILITSVSGIKKIDAGEAKEIIELLEGTEAIDRSKIDPALDNIFKRAWNDVMTKDDILYLLRLEKKEDIEALYSEANTMRYHFLRDFICIHGIIEFSNYCANNCAYCGLRLDNRTVRRYRMPIDEIVSVAEEAVNKIGYKMLVLQSGFDWGYSDNDLIEMARRIREKCRVFLFISIGERSADLYEKLKKTGVGGVLFRFETSNPKLYEKLHPQNSAKGNFQNRFSYLGELKKMGYYISSGPLIGIPGQTKEDLIDDILKTKELGTQMISMGPFVPCDNTPLANEKAGDIGLALKMIAVSRLFMPRSRIPVTTALETLNLLARKQGLICGANALMFNLTPEKYRKNYKIYPDKFYGREIEWEKMALYPGEEGYEMLKKELGIVI